MRAAALTSPLVTQLGSAAELRSACAGAATTPSASAMPRAVRKSVRNKGETSERARTARGSFESVSSLSGQMPPAASPVGGIGGRRHWPVGRMDYAPRRASSKKATTRCSYSSGRVSRAFVWPPSDTSQTVFGPFARS